MTIHRNRLLIVDQIKIYQDFSLARADIILSLVKSANFGDMNTFQKAVNSLIAEERAKNHHILADRLSEMVNHNSNNNQILKKDYGDASDFIYEVTPAKKIAELVLDNDLRNTINDVIEEQHRMDLLHSHGLKVRHRILLTGDPGNGKTSLAEAIAYELMYPYYVIRYDNLIGSYLGETAQRLQKVFSFISQQRCVLFFDEFDTIGKERGDTKETGEIKRVVSSLLLEIDRLPDYVVVITASNHSELLDRAVWRRFQIRLQLLPPKTQQIFDLLFQLSQNVNINLSKHIEKLAPELKGLSYSEIEEFFLDVLRKTILRLEEANITHIISNQLKELKKKVNS